jgi:hypothetical protein
MRSIRVPPTIGGHPNVHWHPWNPLEPSGQGYREIFSILYEASDELPRSLVSGILF